MTSATNLAALLLARGEGASATRPVIEAPGRRSLDGAAFAALVRRTQAALNGAGIGREDRVAIVLPNGPEMAAAFLAIAASATTAPLNPAYKDEEFDFYLGDLGARALVVEAGAETPARAVAARRGIPVIEAQPAADGPAGGFTLIGLPAGRTPARPGFGEADDIALVLHTSGTTSRPKIVPLSQANILASARHIGETLGLAPADRCLTLMPLFHIHGLIGCVLSTVASGGAVICTPGFNALRVYAWVEETRPTWYSAVPTMHQAILARAARNPETVARRPFRFIRSSSAPLPSQVMAEMEATFGCPVIESYGMTEAAHQMTSNRLPPGLRKPRSVGAAAGPEVGIMDPAGRLLPQGEIGEVVIRGPNVTRGYENNPAANASAFTDGWFRTGDQGRLDPDGYLEITGRLKELINRGGEKISPIEIDEVLMDHPAVAQAVAFAVPHAQLGEEVGVAIVLRDGAALTEREARDAVAARLAAFKVPKHVVFVAEIPKGATGKLQRIGLARTLGLAA